MDPKDNVLSRLRVALQVSGDDNTRKAAVAARLNSAPDGVIPARGQLAPQQQVDRVAEIEGLHKKITKYVIDTPALLEGIMQASQEPS